MTTRLLRAARRYARFTRLAIWALDEQDAIEWGQRDHELKSASAGLQRSAQLEEFKRRCRNAAEYETAVMQSEAMLMFRGKR